jgi:2-dehydro-3-deoxy-D-arabinonate dehydratase
MQLCRFYLPPMGARVGAVVDGDVYDLTEAEPGRNRTLGTLLGRAAGFTPSEFVHWVEERLADLVPIASFAELDALPKGRTPHLLAPIDNQEVWAAGVTYIRSAEARETESGQSSLYQRVYHAPRPELFFKAGAHHVAGPYRPVRVRSDSRWTVPEPELALVMDARGTLVGFTIGNDMTARDIEGENALYLPQAKTYSQACALGPVITLAHTFGDPGRATIRLAVSRGGAVVFEGDTTVGHMKRSFDELIEHLWRENEFPNGVILLTGTGIVPPDDFSLQDGDQVSISIDGIGTLTNPVLQRR